MGKVGSVRKEGKITLGTIYQKNRFIIQHQNIAWSNAFSAGIQLKIH